MRAVTWQGREDVQVRDVPEPSIQDARDVVVEVTSTAVCGSDLHLYSVLGPFLDPGDVLGHEAMGIVAEVGTDVRRLSVGDRVVIPFNVACGECWMCRHDLQSQCETTQVHEHGTGGALFGYTKLYGQVPGGQAERVRVPFADHACIRVPDDGAPDERYLYLSDVLPTAWQAVEYAQVPDGGSVVVLGLGPVGQMAARVALLRGAGTVIGVDRVPERLAMAARHGVDVVDERDAPGPDRLASLLRERTGGRGPDAVIDAVGMEAHGSPVAQAAQSVVGLLPDGLARPLMTHAGVDRLAALQTAIAAVRRGGTISVAGVYGGAADPLPLLQIFDKQIQLRMGQANVKHWVDDILPLLTDEDPLGVDEFATHRIALDEAPEAYETFQKKEDGAIKYLIQF